ncbi:formin-like protein 8 [Syzygium oleosum]|uniref:formin-like protein 8 n=1 Tax=Syzygium oleosum TaxID=219896 RepID=UPI0011D23C49|nr:formin-like protein 8 [Syzygium oleosum]
MSLILHLEPRWLLLCRFLLLSACWVGLACSQQNIETFFPLTPATTTTTAITTTNSTPPPFRGPCQAPLPPPPPPPPLPSLSSLKTVIKAVAAAAASSLVVATLFFFVIQRWRRRRGPDHGSAEMGRFAPMPRGDFMRFGGGIKGLIVDENGLDVLYWRRLQMQGERTGSFLEKSPSKVFVRSPRGHKEEDVSERRDGDTSFDKHIQEVPLLREKRSSSREDNDVQVRQVDEDAIGVNAALYPLPPPPSARVAALKAVERPRPFQQPTPTPPRKPWEALTFSAVSAAELPPPPIPAAPPRPPSAVPPPTAPLQKRPPLAASPPVPGSPAARVAVLEAVERPGPIEPPTPPPTLPRKPRGPLTFSAVSTAEPPMRPIPAAPPRPPSAVPPLMVPPQPLLPLAASPPLPQSVAAPSHPPSEVPPPPPPRKPQETLTFSAVSTAEPPRQSLPAAPPRPPSAVPPLPARPTPRLPSAAPPPPPPPPAASSRPLSAAPPPPTPPARPSPVAPPPPPPSKLRGLESSKIPPTPTKGLEKQGKQGEPSASPGQVKLKPLHWEKFEANADHSMVWDKVGDGSFRFDDDLMEDLFGFVPGNRNSTREKETSSGLALTGKTNSNPSSKIFILDPRKSQNIAIVLKTLGVSRNEILYAVTEDQGLSIDVLEKLNKVAPTAEEQSQILQFDGDTTRLADAESYLYHLLKSVPSAFARFNAMLFRSNFKSDILHLKESIRTLEFACEELRTRGLFVKLLEAILKAGNRMNAGTSRGNAQAFNLDALRKLSDVKSIDGKTTLLHFVVEQVVRSEGKRCALNRDYSLSRTSSRRSTSSSTDSENSKPKDERENEYIMLGLPVVGGLSAEFSNVKKAAMIDYDSFASSCAELARGIAEIRQVTDLCVSDGSGLGEELRRFIESAEEELSSLREEQRKAMEFVKRTTEYYQSGASRRNGEKPLHLFIVVKDFLGMVDQVCVEITRNLQRRKTAMASSAPSSVSPKSPTRSPARFPNLSHIMLEKLRRSTSSDSDAEF